MTEIAQSENQVHPSFKDLVLAGQTEWKSRKRFGQTIDLPRTFSERIYEAVLSNLPDYLPKNIRTYLERPAPIIALSMDLPPREIEDELLNRKIVKPNNLTEAEEKYWKIGMQLLNEFVTESLTSNILSKMGEGVPSLPRKFLDFYNSLHERTVVYSPTIRKIQKKYGFEGTQELKEALIKMALSYDTNSIIQANIACAASQDSKIKSLDDLALWLGKETEIKFGKWWHRFIPVARGIYFGELPGVVVVGGRGVLFHTMVAHEIIHYLTDGLDHGGIIPIKTKILPKTLLKMETQEDPELEKLKTKVIGQIDERLEGSPFLDKDINHYVRGYVVPRGAIPQLHGTLEKLFGETLPPTSDMKIFVLSRVETKRRVGLLKREGVTSSHKEVLVVAESNLDEHGRFINPKSSRFSIDFYGNGKSFVHLAHYNYGEDPERILWRREFSFPEDEWDRKLMREDLEFVAQILSRKDLYRITDDQDELVTMPDLSKINLTKR